MNFLQAGYQEKILIGGSGGVLVQAAWESGGVTVPEVFTGSCCTEGHSQWARWGWAGVGLGDLTGLSNLSDSMTVTIQYSGRKHSSLWWMEMT